ncbi:hypothetical protein [Streptomyces jumonjinensis]|uniref:hypothetical protein n=1 Tax=Streptomyces jumonjinensis TaxID=1945 RepID=UPI0037AB2D92
MTSNAASSAPARITLSVCEGEKIAAIATGTQYRWAETALAAAGWSRTEGGVYTRLVGDRTTAERAVSILVHFARRHRAAVVTSTRPHLGTIADTIAHHLPGPWTPTVEVYSYPIWHEDLVPLLWDSGELTHAVQAGQVTHAATLTNEAAGIDLLLIERPDHPSGYVTGAFAPEGFDDNDENPHAPAGVVLPQDPYLAAREIADRYLPAYQQALHTRRAATVASALERIRDEHTELQRLTAAGPDSAYEERFADVAWYEVLDIVRHGRPLVKHCLRTRLSPQDATSIKRFDAALAEGTETVKEWHRLLNGSPDDPLAYRPEEIPLVKALRNADIRPVIETWLAHGDTLLRYAHAASPDSPASLPSAAVPTLSPASRAPSRRH